MIFQRPRKIGARFTGDNFAPDEHIQPDLAFDYEGKRDRWNGYNPDEHQRVYEEFEKIEQVCVIVMFIYLDLCMTLTKRVRFFNFDKMK